MIGVEKISCCTDPAPYGASAARPGLEELFSKALGIPREEVSDDLEYAVDPRWDSVAHMALVAAIDEAYDIMLETEDLLDMSSVAKARSILAKYGVELP